MTTYLELQRLLKRAGFTPEWGKGSHCKWHHPALERPVVLKSNHPGTDAPQAAVREVRRAIREAERSGR